MYSSFTEFLKQSGIISKKWALVLPKRYPTVNKIYSEIKEKGIKLEEFWNHHLNLKLMFKELINNKGMQNIFNMNKIKDKLKYKDLSHCLSSFNIMCDLLNVKQEEKFLNNLDLVENEIRLIQKLIDKGVSFTNEYELDTFEKCSDHPMNLPKEDFELVNL